MAKKAAKPKVVDDKETTFTETAAVYARGAEPQAAAPNPISKAEAIRTMMAECIDNPSAASAEIKKRFGLDVTPQHFSAARSQMKSKAGATKGKPGRKPKAAVEGYLAPPPKPQAPGEQPDLLAAMEAMKPLVEALSADKVHRIVDLLG